MSQYDAAATPMWRCFADAPNSEGFTSLRENVDLKERNLASNKWQKMSEDFDFAKEDLAPEKEFNEVIWAAVKGDKIPCPAPKHAAFFQSVVSDEKNKDKD